MDYIKKVNLAAKGILMSISKDYGNGYIKRMKNAKSESASAGRITQRAWTVSVVFAGAAAIALPVTGVAVATLLTHQLSLKKYSKKGIKLQSMALGWVWRVDYRKAYRSSCQIILALLKAIQLAA